MITYLLRTWKHCTSTVWGVCRVIYFYSLWLFRFCFLSAVVGVSVSTIVVSAKAIWFAESSFFMSGFSVRLFVFSSFTTMGGESECFTCALRVRTRCTWMLLDLWVLFDAPSSRRRLMVLSRSRGKRCEIQSKNEDERVDEKLFCN